MKRKLTLTILSFTALAVVVACGAITVFELQELRRTRNVSLASATDALAIQLAGPLGSGDTAALIRRLQDIADDRIGTITVYSADGAVLSQQVRRRQEWILSLVDDEELCQSLGDGKAGTICVRRNYDEMAARIARTALIGGVTLLVFGLVAPLLANALTSGITKPIRALAQMVQTATEQQNYSYRVPKESGPAAPLADVLNDMLEQIQQREVMLRRRTTELEVANKEIEAFSYSVSHDLRAPLRVLKGFSDALEEDHAENLGEEGLDYVRRIRAAAERMAALLDDLILLAKVSRQELRQEEVDLSAIASSLATELRVTDPGRKVEFIIQPNLKVSGDATLLRAVLDNLLRNAWKFTSKHSTARIEFGAEPSAGRQLFFVKDDGAGFNPENQMRLFTAFQRLHSQKEFEGTGIGLATVHRIITRHGGRIWAEGEPEKGATFFFEL